MSNDRAKSVEEFLSSERSEYDYVSLDGVYHLWTGETGWVPPLIAEEQLKEAGLPSYIRRYGPFAALTENDRGPDPEVYRRGMKKPEEE